jgi:replicative DNA helicase
MTTADRTESIRMAEIRRLPVPPQSTEAEQAVLGALLIDRTAWARIASRIAAADFFRPDHRIIFGAIARLINDQVAVDVVTVADLLERQGTLVDAGGLAYIATLARDTPTGANVEGYYTAVRERASLRQLRAIGEEIMRRVADADGSAGELVADVQEQLQRLQTQARTGKGLISARQLASELIDDLDRRSSGQTGLSLGLPDFDALTCGLEPGDLVVIAARPGVGKTALLVSVAAHISKDRPTAVFSAEMPAMQLMRRALAAQSNIPQGLLRRAEKLKQEDWQAITPATESLAQRRLWVDDTAAPMLAHIRAECIALNARERLGLVLIDYVQLVRGAGANRYEQLRDVAYGLKALAKDLAVPIIVLAQLNRGVESRERKRPTVSDLRDSGAIEEAADIVGLLYSEGYYDHDFGMPYVLECLVEKNRNGERGVCLWRFDGAHSRVTLLDDGATKEYRTLQARKQQRGGIDL